jgi:hypothetical protein
VAVVVCPLFRLLVPSPPRVDVSAGAAWLTVDESVVVVEPLLSEQLNTASAIAAKKSTLLMVNILKLIATGFQVYCQGKRIEISRS